MGRGFRFFPGGRGAAQPAPVSLLPALVSRSPSAHSTQHPLPRPAPNTAPRCRASGSSASPPPVAFLPGASQDSPPSPCLFPSTYSCGAPGGRGAVSNTVSSLGEARRGGCGSLSPEAPVGCESVVARQPLYPRRYHRPAPSGRSRCVADILHRASPLRGSTRCYSRPRALRALRNGRSAMGGLWGKELGAEGAGMVWNVGWREPKASGFLSGAIFGAARFGRSPLSANSAKYYPHG